ncbi:MAG: hypothetical protein JTT11_03825, partial [Candidatus Brockarchaeota archaeon]|nr:hypothetical protein [Candidatus Brockarchaeota archaeon]
TSEITRYTGQRRKAITDALRKLKNKGLIEIDSKDKEAVYKLGESGVKCYNDLMEFVGIAKSEPSRQPGDAGKGRLPDATRHKPDQRDRGNFALTTVVSEMVLALGTTRGNAMYLKDLAKIVNLSEQRAESYLKLYLDGEHRLFRRFTDDPGWAKGMLNGESNGKKSGVIYALTNEGLQYFYRMPIYSRLRGSLAYNFLSRITLASHPRSIYRRLALMMYVGGVSSLAVMILPYGFILTGLWIFLTTVIGTFMATGSIF